MKSLVKIYGQTALGCSFVVSQPTPTVVVDEKKAKPFTMKVATRIKAELEKGGDCITLKPTEDGQQ